MRRWIQAAWVVAGDSVRVMEGFSRATGSWYSAMTVADRNVSVAPGGQVVVDTSVLRVAVVSDRAYREDARYVKAALVALQKYTLRRIVVVDRLGAGGNWLFWLSDRTVLENDRNVRVFEYEAWKKSKGNPKDMEWSGAFPMCLEKLLFNDAEIGDKDRRALDPGQIVPLRRVRVDRNGAGLHAMGGGGNGAPAANAGAEAFLFWVVIFLFILERILVNGKQTT